MRKKKFKIYLPAYRLEIGKILQQYYILHDCSVIEYQYHVIGLIFMWLKNVRIGIKKCQNIFQLQTIQESLKDTHG